MVHVKKKERVRRVRRRSEKNQHYKERRDGERIAMEMETKKGEERREERERH